MIHLRLCEGSQTVLERPLALSAVEAVAGPLNDWATLSRSMGRVPRAMLICGDVIRIIRLPPAAGE